MTLLAPLALLAFIVGGFCFMFGACELAKRLLLFALALALVAPLLPALLHELYQAGVQQAGDHYGLIILAGLVIVAIAKLRFRGRKRRLEQLLAGKPTGLKGRVEKQ